MTRTAVAIEFVGLPGCGKSSLSRHVADLLRPRSIPVREPTYRLDHGPGTIERTARKSFHVAREVLRQPGYAVRSASALRATGQESPAILTKMLFNWLLVSSLMRRTGVPPGVTLFDQGIFQALWSIGLGGREGAVRSMSESLGDLVPLPDAVIVVEVSRASVVHRLRLRQGHDSRADAWHDQDASRFSRALAILEEVKEMLAVAGKAHRSLRVLAIRNERTEDLEANASTLAAEIASMAGGRVA